MSSEQMGQLREHLDVIRDHFQGLYNHVPGEPPPPPPPLPPVSPTVTGVSTTDVTLQWQVPTGDGPLIRNYDVRYREGSDGAWEDGPRDVRRTGTAIEGLDPDTEYEVQVRS